MSYDEAFYEAARRAADKERGKMYEPEPQAAAIQQHAAAIMVAAEKIKQGLDGIAQALEAQADREAEGQMVKIDVTGKGIEAALERSSKAQARLAEVVNNWRRQS